MPTDASVDSVRKMTSRLGSTTRLQGELIAAEPLLIVGRFKGSIEALNDTITIAEHAEVEANITAANVLIAGIVRGSVKGIRRAQLSKTANMSGQLITREIRVEEGAIFRGQVDYLADGKGDRG